MFSKLSILRPLFVASIFASGAAAHAGNINTSGTVCRNYNAAQALDIDYVTSGVRNINAAARQIICPVPRSPLSTAPTPTFYVDGHNNANTTTSCTVTVYSFNGTITQSQSFTQSGGTTTGVDWDQQVLLPTLPANFDYVSLLCTIPASSGGTLRGITAVQP